MSVFVCSSSTRIHHFRAFLFTCYSPNNKRLHSTFLSYHFGIPIFKQKCDHFCCFQHQNNVYERPLLLFRKNLSLKVNNEQCCYLSGMIRNSGWKAGSWLLFHPKPHHNTPVTHPIACLGHSWGYIVRRIEHKRVVNTHFMSMKATWFHLLLLKLSLSLTGHTLSSLQILLPHPWVTVGHMGLMYAGHIRL